MYVCDRRSSKLRSRVSSCCLLCGAAVIITSSSGSHGLICSHLQQLLLVGVVAGVVTQEYGVLGLTHMWRQRVNLLGAGGPKRVRQGQGC